MLFEAFASDLSIEKIGPLVEHLLEKWFKKSKQEPADLYGQLPIAQKREDILEVKCTETINDLDGLLLQFPVLKDLGWTNEKVLQTVNEIAKRMENKLPVNIKTNRWT